MRTTIFVTALLVTAVIAGCVGGTPTRKADPAELQVSAAWRGGIHLDIDVRNVGGSSISLSGADMIRVIGPDGTVPVDWNGVGPMLRAGESVTFDLHATHMTNGMPGLTMDQAHSDHIGMPPGNYIIWIANMSAVAAID